MQQKVALAVAMLHNPSVLLLDEPTLGLDVASAQSIETAIREMTRQGRSVLLTTHQMHLAERLSHHILVIHQGRKVAEGPPNEIIHRFGGEQTTEVRLGAALPETALQRLKETFPPFSATVDADTTLLAWAEPLPQQALLDLLNRLNRLDAEGFPILQVGRREATLEEVFVKLTSGKVKP